ncbi:MAG TPA: hypothetical protein PK079_24050 [Leptospiraceae bacterium]|nr:hypothetical protein [Leptospiraceae bacterium]HMW08574.1 hypothetical protein [Leptospiraceae bacterium]HMZ66483.1 hypothetical protein [Leptospiraceae bacterium]HNA10025.1 hypothetical protein [Leptospiraceae bacterium]HNC00256.1 hypothetical protein [Leptospiraceae bacterium]
MYPQSIKTRAYHLFVTKGYTCERIAKELRKEYPKITGNTIRKWSEERTDNNSQTWIEQKNSIEKNVVERINEKTISAIVDIRAKNKILIQEIFKRIIDKSAPEAKSFEGLIYAFKAISSFEAQLEKDAGEKDKLSPAQVIQIILEIFQANPKIANVIRAEWHSVSEQLHQQLLDEPKS